MSQDLLSRAAETLKLNDLGRYTVPRHGLYPFQWNWDSCFTALAQVYFDETRAWMEIETLFEHQWSDGMVPHIIFHKHDDGYFPGPEVWRTERDVPTSGITQPPVAGFTIVELYRRSKDRDAAAERARALLLKVVKWHEWFYRCRDPMSTGLVAVIHPWETGRDNSADWDEAFERVPTEGVEPFVRKDTQHANPAHRPTQSQYERYIWLVQKFRSLNWDNEKLHEASPFRMVDPGFNAILLRSIAEVRGLAVELGETEIATRSELMLKKGLNALDSLWNESINQYSCYDRILGKLIDTPSVGGILAVFAPIPNSRALSISQRIEIIAKTARYLVPSHDLNDASYDGERYWRGPVWLIVNFMISNGLDQAGLHEIAKRIKRNSLELIETGGFAEYYNPMNGNPCGGDKFTWTAAIVIEFLKNADVSNS